MDTINNYYKILEVDENATKDEIKKSYRRLSFLYHPDKNPNDFHKAELFKQINEAYQTLSDETKRNQYDFDLNLKQGNHMQMNFNDPMDAFMGSFFETVLQSKPKNKRKQAAKTMDDIMNIIGGGLGMNMAGNVHNINMTEIPPDFIFNTIPGLHNMSQIHKENEKPEPEEILEDIHTTHEIEFEESYHGCCVPIIVTRIINHGQMKNNKETEKLYLNIPKGVDNDEIIMIENKGHILNNRQSHVKVHIKVKDHHVFKRNGIHLILPKQISFKESLTGFDFILEHLNDSKTKLSSSRGNIIQNGDKKVIKNLGFERNDKKGDLIILFHVLHPPEKLNETQLKIIEDNF